MNAFKISLFSIFALGFLLLIPQVVHAETKTVNIQDFQFDPQIVIISPGDTVTWTNKDSMPHTATSDSQTGNGAWDSGLLQTNQSYSKTFTTPGTYTYHCSPHPNMVAVVQVGTQVTLPTPGASSTNLPAQTVQDPISEPATLSFTLFLNGIGKAGDSLSKGSGNPTPKRTQRSANIAIMDGNKAIKKVIPATVTYAAANGNFTGTAGIDDIAAGTYQIKIKADGFLESTSQSLTISAGQTTSLPPLYVTTGDANNDNLLNALDYNVLLSCFGSKMNACQDSQAADFNDDGVIDGIDYNLFLREIKAASKA